MYSIAITLRDALFGSQHQTCLTRAYEEAQREKMKKKKEDKPKPELAKPTIQFDTALAKAIYNVLQIRQLVVFAKFSRTVCG